MGPETLARIAGDEAVEWGGVRYLALLTPEQTGGAMSITTATSPPASGPPLHIHHDADEVFVIHAGRHLFQLEDERFEKGPGETVFVPRGKAHTFQILGTETAHHTIILTPGGFEGFFHEMAKRGCRIPQDMDEVVAVAETFHLTFTGPPLPADG